MKTVFDLTPGAYAGIGSRETPGDVLNLMQSCAEALAALGWTLRSGNARGADQAFAAGHLSAISGSPIELYLPWPSFNGYAIVGWIGVVARHRPQGEAYEIAERFHPNWAACTGHACDMHARNVHQILGKDVIEPDLSKFVLCWTKNAIGAGGTGQAIRIARHHSVPILDLASAPVRASVEAWLNSHQEGG